MLTYSLQWLVLSVDASVKSLLLALTAAIVLRALRVRDSQVRHRVWTGVLAGMLLLPVLSQVVPDLQLPFIVRPEWLTMSNDEAPASAPVSPAPVEPAPLWEASAEATSSEAGEFSRPHMLDGPPSELASRDTQSFSDHGPASPDHSQPAARVESATINTAAPQEAAVDSATVDPALSSSWQTRLLARWPQLLLGLWLTGVGFITLRLLLGVLMAWRLKRASTEITPDDLAEFGVSHAPRRGGRLVPILECPLIRVPLTLGFLKPVILLPEVWLEWPTEKLEAVLSHEQTHVERGDCAVAFLAEFNLCFNWFHPLAWWLRRTLSVLAEEACDDAAIGSIGDRATYARHLLEVAAAVSPRQGRLIQPGVAMARRSNVESRIDAILDFTRPLSERPTWATTLVILALATPVIAFAAALRPASPKTTEETTQANPVAVQAEPETPNLIALADPAADAKPKSTAEATRSRSYSGRVTDADGRVIAGAEIWLSTGGSEETSSLAQVATTKHTGEFSFELTPEQAARCDERIGWPNLIAKQSGFGLDVLPLEVFAKGPASASAHGGRSETTANQIARVDQVFGEGRAAGKTLKLRPQVAPVQGRLMTIEGKPLAGVKVVVLELQEPDVETLLSAFEKKSKDIYYKASNAAFVPGRHLHASQLRTLIPPVTTDANGSFTLSGLGRDQLALLTFEGERVDAETLHVFVRDMQTQRIPHIQSYPDGNQETYVGLKFTHVLGPGVPVAGVVKDFKTGQPIPDTTVFVERLFRETGASPNHLRLDVRHIRTKTDAQGRYRLVGIPPGGKHLLHAFPPTTQPWLGAAQEFSVDPDAMEAKVDIQVFRGIWVEGRVTDATSGEPVEGCVEYMALQSNPNIPQRSGLEDVFRDGQFDIGRDGRYRTVGLPGPGVLMVRNLGKTKYPLTVGAKDVPGYNPKNNWLPTTPTALPLSNWALLKPIDPAVDAASFSIDLTLSAGESVAGRVVGVDGKPPVAFEAMKLVEKNAFWSPCQNGAFTLHHYDGKGPRHVFFRSLDLSQVGQWRVEGSAPKDVEVKLQPAVRVTGRLIETETNEPADGYYLYCRSCSAGDFRMEEDLTTDRDGRFTIRGLSAGLTYKIDTFNQKRYSSGKSNFTIDLTSAKPGDVVELGDVTGKSAKLAGNSEKPASAAMKAPAGKGDENGATTEPLTPLIQLIRGRLIDTEGRPVAGAVVRVVELKAANSSELLKWIEMHRRESGGAARTVMTMQRQSQERPPSGQKIEIAPDAYVATTDADGRFKIDGIGMDSALLLRVDKAGIASALVDLVAREMDPLRVGAEDSRERRVYYGAQFDYVVEPEAPVTGRLTDVDSGEPIRGARVSVSIDEVNSDRRKLSEITAVTDDDGKYEAHGLPRRRGNRMYVAFADQPYLSAESMTLPKPPASGPTTFDVAFKRGVWVSGVVKDQLTGEPVKGKICYTPFANNEFLKQHPRYAGGMRRMLEHFPSGETDADGKYRVLVIQGHGVVCFQAADRNAYVPGFGQEAISDLANSKVQVVDSGIDVSFHALKEIDPAADAREIVADLQVDKGRMITFKFVDPEGRRLTSVTTRGLKTKTTRGAETAEVRFTSAAETRCLEIGDDNTGLRTILRFTSEPKQTEATVTLHAPARVTGRLLDVDHQPLKDLPLDAHYTPQAGWGSSPPFCKDDPRPISDQDGRFTMLLPAGEKFSVFIRSQRGLAKLLKADLTATPGETIDLGDLEINTEDRSDAKPLQPEKRTPAANKVAQASESPKSAPSDDPVFRYAGTVVDEAGKPIAGATVALNYSRLSTNTASPLPVATTNAEGKFEITRRKSEFVDGWSSDAWSYATLLATKPGYGLAAGHSSNFETSGSLRASLSGQMRRVAESLFGRKTNVLTLPADMPIEGRIITTDGRPVAGATITPYNADEGSSGSLEEWEKSTKEPGANFYTARQKLVRISGGDFINGPIDPVTPPATTDADGRFTLAGLGRERLAKVFVTGPGIEASEFYIRSRVGKTIKLSDSERGEDKYFKTYYPAEFTHVAGPSQPVTGVVKDLKTGQPLAGFFVRSERTTASRVGGNSGYIRAMTDEQGRFTLNGFPLGSGNEFVVLPPKGSKYLPAGVSIKTTLSSEPLVKDVPLTEGIPFRGKVTDAKNGKPVEGYAEYFVFTDNPALEQTKNFRIVDQRHTYSTDAEGRFEIPVLPGPGIVTFWANDFQTYPRGAGRESIKGKDAGIGGAMYAFSTWPYHLMADNVSSLTQVDPAPDAKSVDIAISLTPTQTFSARVVAADGRIPTEYFVYGERSPAGWYESRGGSITVRGYLSEYGRRLMAFEPSTDLIGLLDVTGEPPADAVITLKPATRFVGRLVDENGTPLPETRIEGGWRSANEPNAAMMNARRWRGGFELERGEFVPLKGRAVITDENGRFEFRGIMPGLKYSAQAMGMKMIGNENYLTSLGAVLDDVVAKPGPVNDLGDVVLKPEKPVATEEKVTTKKPAEEIKKENIVSGTVLGPDGKPLTNAHVAIVGYPNQSRRGGDYGGFRYVLLAEAPVDPQGKFSIDLKRNPLESHRYLRIIAGGAGLATAWKEFDPSASQPLAFQLQPEQLISVRLLDIDGHTASGVKAVIDSIADRGASGNARYAQGPGENPPAAWPQAVISDKDGVIVIRGVSAECGAYLKTEATDKFAPQSLGVNTGQPESRPSNDGTYRPQFRNASAGQLVTFVLAPAQIFEGTVRFADTKEPAPFARVAIGSSQQGTGSSISTSGAADEKGHYRIHANPGANFSVSIYPPDGAPYLTPTQRDIKWGGGIGTKTFDAELPRGVMIRGTIVDAVSGAPEAGASIQYMPRDATEKKVGVDILTGWQGIQLSRPDGSFEIVVAPGAGSLLVHGKQGKFVLQEIGSRYLDTGLPGGQRYYAHAVVPIDPTVDTQPPPIRVELQPAASVQGKVVDESGTSLSDVQVISKLKIHPTSPYWRSNSREPQFGGKFELSGLLPGRDETVHFLHAKQKLGATAVLNSSRPEPTIVLKPCGEAKARIIRADGSPIIGISPWIDFVMTPGGLRLGADVMKSTALAADREFNVNIDQLNYHPHPKTDEKGLITFPALIPGATYQIRTYEKNREVVKAEFVGESGKTIDLGEIVMDRPNQD